MKKDQLSFSDVERLLSELAQHDRALAAQEDAQTELMRKAASGEIRRVFFRRRCLRVAGSTAMLVLLGGGISLLYPEWRTEAPALATSLNTKHKLAPAPCVQALNKCETAPNPPISYTTTIGGKENACEVFIYAVPL